MEGSSCSEPVRSRYFLAATWQRFRESCRPDQQVTDSKQQSASPSETRGSACSPCIGLTPSAESGTGGQTPGAGLGRADAYSKTEGSEERHETECYDLVACAL